MIDIFTFITKIGQRIKDYGDGQGSESRLGYSYDNGNDEPYDAKFQNYSCKNQNFLTWQKIAF